MAPPQAIDRFAYSRNGGGQADERCMIRVNIPGVTSDTQHTHYKIDVTNVQTRQTWQTSHRYSEFLALRNSLIAHFAKAERKCPGCVNFDKVIQLFEFPTKHMFTSKNPVVINYRKKALRSFLALLASHTFSTSPKCPTCSGFAFTAVRDFLTDEPDTRGSLSSSASSDDPGMVDRGTVDRGTIDRGTIRETIKVKDFTTYVPVPSVKPVNSQGAFIGANDRGKKATGNRAGSAARSRKQKPAAEAPRPPPREEVPSPQSSTSSSSSSTPRLPASPQAVNRQARENAESFLSFSGDASPVAKPSHAGSTPRGGSKKNKRGSSHPSIESQASVKESQDDEEFGSLNMDFMNGISVAK